MTSVWQQWLESWLEQIDLMPDNEIVVDQFCVKTDKGQQYVLENCIDHVMLSLRLPLGGYQDAAYAKRLLQLADPQALAPYPIRLGLDASQYCIVALRFDYEHHTPDDLKLGFDQLFSVCEELDTMSND